MNEVCIVTSIKVSASIIAAIIALITFVIPLIKTYIPIIVATGKISYVLTFRLILRFSIFLLLLHEIINPIEEIIIPKDGAEFILLQGITSIGIIVLSLIMIGAWLMHPDGIKGL